MAPLCVQQGAPPESEPWFCPVCKYPDRGRPLLRCATCSDSFHFECAGTNAEVGAACCVRTAACSCCGLLWPPAGLLYAHGPQAPMVALPFATLDCYGIQRI